MGHTVTIIFRFTSSPTHRSGNTLDLIITRTSDGVLHGHPSVDAMLSDHCSLLFKVQIRKPPPLLKKVSYRKVKDIDFDDFRKDVAESRLITETHSDLSELVQCYNESLTAVLDYHAPIVTRDVPVRSRQPWYNDNIRTEKQARRRLERKWKRDRSHVNEEMLRHQKNKVNHVIDSTRSQFYSQKIEECGTDQKKTFGIIKGLFMVKLNIQNMHHCLS